MHRLKDILRHHRNLVIIVTAALLLELISASQYYYTHGLLESELENHAESELTIKAVIIKGMLNMTESTLDEHVWDIESHLGNADSMFAVTRRMIMANEMVTGGCIAFVPDYYMEKGRLFEPYAWKENGEVKVQQLGGTDGHDYTEHPAWSRMQQEGAPFWSDPYEYKTGTEVTSLTTYSYPLYDQSGRLVAVCGLDISLQWVGDTLNVRHAYPSSFDLLLTESGDVISGPSKSHARWFDTEKVARLLKNATTGMETAKGKSSRSGRSKIITFKSDADGANGCIFYASMRGKPHWQLAVVCYDNEVYGKLKWMRLLVTSLMLIALAVLGFIIHRFARNERRLHTARLEQERIGSELRIAKDIQMGMLPRMGQEMAKDEERLKISGWLAAAKEVGGDIFDYFVREDKLFFCIGDVSGKGIPSAMIMAMIHSLFRMVSVHEDNPAAMMSTLNMISCEGNERNLFITFFIGVLDLQTGRLQYCNAGHEIPILLKENGKEEMLNVVANIPIGLFDDFHYELQETCLNCETTLFLYTDGLTEGKDRDGNMFGIERVRESLRNTATVPDDPTSGIKNPENILQSMKNVIHDFVDGAEQSDDLTMMVIQYTPPKTGNHEEQIILRNDISEIKRLKDFVDRLADKTGLDTRTSREIRLVLEEAAVNVINYAYPQKGNDEGISITVTCNGQLLKLVITDTGIPFDPTKAGDVDSTLSAEDRAVGGLGIHLMRKLTDSMSYERRNEKNILTMTKTKNKERSTTDERQKAD